MSGQSSSSEAFFNRIDHHTFSNIARQATLGNADLLLKNLQEDEPWDVCDNRGWFPIHCATHSGHTSCIQILLRHSEKNFKNTKAYNGETPLFLAALHGHSNAMETLLSHDADINICNNELVSVLVAAVKGQNKDCVKICLDNNVTIDAQDAGGWSALHEAAFLGDTTCLQLLLSAGAYINIQNSDKASPLFVTAQYGHTKCLNILIKEMGSIDLQTHDKATPLFIASQEGHLECVQSLVGAGAEVNKTTIDLTTGLHTAAERGHLEIVRLLVKAGADVNATSLQDVTPLHLAADKDELECLIELIESGADTKAQLQADTALELAASIGSVKCCEELVKRGCDPNRSFLKNDTLETTTLMEAIDANENECVEILLKYGADPDKESYSYPIIVASKELNPLGISLLIKYGANVNVLDKARNSALYMVIRKLTHSPPNLDNKQKSVKLECAKILLKAGADLQFALARNTDVFSSALPFPSTVELIKLLLVFSPNDSKLKNYAKVHYNLYTSEEVDQVMELFNNPSNLLHLCRLRVRELLGQNRLQKINTLQVPEMMKDYVKFCDL